MQELGKLNLFARNIPCEQMGLCIYSQPCLHWRSYLQNTPSNYCLAYQAGSRSAHSIWPLSWQRPNGCSGGGGLMRRSAACLAKWDCQSFSCWHQFKECGVDGQWRVWDGQNERERERKGGEWVKEEEEEDKREVKEESWAWKAPEVWFRGGRGGGGPLTAAKTLSGSPRGSC